MMPWVVFGLLTAFFESLKDFSSKRSGAALGSFTLAFANTLFALPIFAYGLLGAEVPTVTAHLQFLS